MAQKVRTIHPSDATDERLANLPLSAAYTYAYLPTVLDDEGRAKDQPSVFNGYLWPLRADEHSTAVLINPIPAAHPTTTTRRRHPAASGWAAGEIPEMTGRVARHHGNHAAC